MPMWHIVHFHLRNISHKIPIANNIEMITMSSFKYAGLIISIIISLISCTHNKNYPTAFQPELAKAEAMMYRYPDSALHILQGIQPDIPGSADFPGWQAFF